MIESRKIWVAQNQRNIIEYFEQCLIRLHNLPFPLAPGSSISLNIWGHICGWLEIGFSLPFFRLMGDVENMFLVLEGY